jgi:hypothetical protein
VGIAKEVLWKNLVEEIRLTMLLYPDFNIEEWKKASLSGQAQLTQAYVDSTMDMGWNKRSSGVRFDSLSGHAVLYGVLTRLPIAMCSKSKYCSICSWWQKNKDGMDAPEHSCEVNHEGSLGSMESDALLEMVTGLWRNSVVQSRHVVTDDDSTMRANCRWSNDDYMAVNELSDCVIGQTVPDPNKPSDKSRPIKRKGGCLPVDVPEPKFLADPSHRKKTLKNHLYKMLKKKKDERHGLVDGDIVRLTQFWIYMVRQLKDAPEEEYEDRAAAVLLHHFDCHEKCGNFCKRKNETPEEKQQSNKTYRCRTQDAELFNSLSVLLQPFVSLKGLKDVAHGWDTNPNESMNNTIAWIAPKNKNYSGTNSLRVRISIAVSIQSLGYDECFLRIFKDLGLDMDNITAHKMKMSETGRQYQQMQAKSFQRKLV